MPVVGGNVSLYNESPDGPILPTPVIGMVGKLPDARRAGRLGFAEPGDAIALVGGFNPSRDGSELAKLHGERARWRTACQGRASDPRRPRARAQGVRSTARFTSAHDIAEGGIAVALAECCIAGGLGADRSTLPEGLDPFGEDLGTAFIVTGPEPSARRACRSSARSVVGELSRRRPAERRSFRAARGPRRRAAGAVGSRS